MQSQIGNSKEVVQSFQPLSDLHGRLEKGTCGSVQVSLRQDSEAKGEKSLPSSILSLEGQTVRLKTNQATSYIGSYSMRLVFAIDAFHQEFSFPFQVVIDFDVSDPAKRITGAEYKRLDLADLAPSEEKRFPAMEVTTDRLNVISLPELKGWKDNEKVKVSMLVTNSKLKPYVTLVTKNTILIDLPPDLTGEVSSILLGLSDGNERSLY